MDAWLQVAHGYSHLQVTLAVTLDTGEVKDVATMIAEKGMSQRNIEEVLAPFINY